MLGALLAGVATAQAAELQFGRVPADLHARAVALFANESGAPVAAEDVIISAVDLSGDAQLDIIAYARTPFYCDDRGCEPRIFLFDGTSWRNILEPGLVRSAVPARFLIVNVSRTGFSDILVGSLMLVFDGEYYVEERPPEPTVLDTAAFETACAASPRVAALLAQDSIPERGIEFCACVGGLFELQGMEQQDLDDAAALYLDAAAPADAELVAIVADYELSCRIELTLD